MRTSDTLLVAYVQFTPGRQPMARQAATAVPAMTETEFYDKAEQMLREMIAGKKNLAVWRIRNAEFQGRFHEDAILVGHPESERPEIPSEYIILGVAKEIPDGRFHVPHTPGIKIYYEDFKGISGTVGGSTPGEHLLRSLVQHAEGLRTF